MPASNHAFGGRRAAAPQLRVLPLVAPRDTRAYALVGGRRRSSWCRTLALLRVVGLATRALRSTRPRAASRVASFPCRGTSGGGRALPAAGRSPLRRAAGA